MAIRFYEGNQKLPVSAIVTSLNEGHLLQDCLRSISFCDEIIVADLNSNDSTEAVAKACGAKVVKHDLVPVVEMIHGWLAPQAKHEWLLLIDPDERIDKVLADELIILFGTLSKDVAIVRVPIVFYLGRHPLNGTVWGGENTRPLFLNKSRVDFLPDVHAGLKIREGNRILIVPFNNERTNIDHHLWSEGFMQLIKKHHRYLLKEGDVRFRRGERFSWKNFFIVPLKSFYYCFFFKKGYRDGITGLLLSFFWGYYNLRIQWAIHKSGKASMKSH